MAMTLGNVQLRIMRVLWREGEIPARRISEVLGESSSIAHSTVQTLLRKLEAKGAVTHELRDRTFYYRATIAESEVTRSAAQELLSRLFQGSLSGLVEHLLDHEEVPEEEMARLRELVRQKSEEETR